MTLTRTLHTQLKPLIDKEKDGVKLNRKEKRAKASLARRLARR